VIRIDKIEAFRVSIPMREPFRISSGEVADKEAIIVKLYDGEAFGWGESSAMPGGFYSADTPDSCETELIENVLPDLAGRAFDSMAEVEEFLLHKSKSGFVRAAVETAAWELLARKRGVPLRELFGLADRPIPSGLAIGLYADIEELRQAIDRNRPHDYHRLKIKIKRGQDVELVAKVREWLGGFPLFVDANADYGRDAYGVFQQLDAYNLMMFEQPLAKDDLEGSAELQRLVRTPVCLDEGVESLADARRAIALQSCRIVNIKLQRVGGYSEALRIVNECAVHNIPVWMGTMPELGIGSAQALVLAAHPAFAYPTDVEPSDRWYVDDILDPELKLRDAYLHLPGGPGLGFTVNTAKLAKYTVRQWMF
jgi:O-succinylbenzoate synthase